MKTYIKFLTTIFLKSFFYIILVIFSLVFIINFLTELEFFKDIDTNIFFTIYLALINAPSMIFEIFPFILLLSTQLFYIKLFTNSEIEIFKYSGLKNSKILLIISFISLLLGIVIISFYYNISSSLKNNYLELKSNYTKDGKYLAVINKNGLWIRDKINDKILIINSSKIDKHFLLNTFITEFDKDYKVIRNIKSDKIDIKNYDWKIFSPEIFVQNVRENNDEITIKSNFDYKRIQTLFSNLSSLSLMKLIELKRNYILINYSTVEISLQIHRILSYPIYLVLMTVFSAIIMLNTKKFINNTLKISIGIFFCVVIYYLNNIFNVLGKTEKINYIISVWSPLLILAFIIFLITNRVNEK